MKPDGGQKLRPFDLSRRDVFSVKSGVLNGNLFLHTLPESKYDVSHAQITRVDPIQTASFARMSENYEYYFVPYSQIFQGFERLYYERGDVQRNNVNSNLFDPVGQSSFVPRFDYHSVVYRLGAFFIASRFYQKMHESAPDAAELFLRNRRVQYNPNALQGELFPFDVHGEICIDEMLKLFDMAGYGNLYSVFNSLLSPFFGFDLPSYLRPEDELVSPDSDKDIAAANINRAFASSLATYFGCSYLWSNNAPTFHSTYDDIISYMYDLFAVMPVTNTDTASYRLVPRWTLSSVYSNLVQTLQTMVVSFSSSGGVAEYADFLDALENQGRTPNILNLAAYVKVFADIYRNTQFDNQNYSSLFNFDYVTNDDLSLLSTNKVLNMLIPRFRQYKKDVFTGVFPNAQFGSVAISGLSNPTIISISDVDSAETSTSPQPVRVSFNANNKGKAYVAQGSNYYFDWDINTGVSALAIRQALSLQRYKERILRAGNRIQALQAAVFGDRSRFIENNYVQFIGAEHNMIDLNTVAATSDAGQSEVGQLGANGVGTHVGKCFEFHSHDFGVIVGIYYILPESEYEANSIDPMLTKTETNDFYKPDFMNLGLSPVFNYNFSIFTSFDDSVLGYLANYWEYKTSIDRVHGNFYGSLPFIQTTSQETQYFGPGLVYARLGFSSADAFSRGSNAYYVTPRKASAFAQSLMLSNLYVNPHDLDSIFYVNSDFTLETDQFKVNCNHEIKALLPMSVVGLPEY